MAKKISKKKEKIDVFLALILGFVTLIMGLRIYLCDIFFE